MCVYLLSNDGDELLVLILVCGEDDARSSGVTDLADVCTITPNEEAVVLLLGTHLPDTQTNTRHYSILHGTGGNTSCA